MKVVMHTCNTCGQEKEIYLKPEEKAEELEGCVCNRTTDKRHELEIIE